MATDYTEESWEDGDQFTPEQATEMSREIEELEDDIPELAYASTTSTATFTTALVDVAGLSIAVPQSERSVRLEADLGSISAAGGGWHQISLCKADNTIIQSVIVTTVAGPLPDVPAPPIVFILPPGTAAATYKIRIGAANAGGIFNAQGYALSYAHTAFIRATH